GVNLEGSGVGLPTNSWDQADARRRSGRRLRASAAARRSASRGASPATVMRTAGPLFRRYRSPARTAQPACARAATIAASSTTGTQTLRPERPPLAPVTDGDRGRTGDRSRMVVLHDEDLGMLGEDGA